jgi:hypothetical protein
MRTELGSLLLAAILAFAGCATYGDAVDAFADDEAW